MARDFDGSDDMIVFPNAFDATGTPLTFVAKVRFDSISGNFYVFCIHDTGDTQRFIIEYTDFGGAQWRWARDNTGFGYYSRYMRSGTNMPTTGQWYQMVVRAASGTPSDANSDIMFDGVEPGTLNLDTTGGTEEDMDGDWSIGGSHFSGVNMNGQIAEVGVWDRLLSDAEIGEILDYSVPPSYFPYGLKFYVPLIGEQSENNLAEPGGSGTITGTSYYSHPRTLRPCDG